MPDRRMKLRPVWEVQVYGDCDEQTVSHFHRTPHGAAQCAAHINVSYPDPFWARVWPLHSEQPKTRKDHFHA